MRIDWTKPIESFSTTMTDVHKPAEYVGSNDMGGQHYVKMAGLGSVRVFDGDGKPMHPNTGSFHVRNIPQKSGGLYLNVDADGCWGLNTSRKAADKEAAGDRIACIRIADWTEGRFDE